MAVSDQSDNQASDNEMFSRNNVDNYKPFPYMGDEPKVTLTPAEQAMASHTPSVRASMVVCNTQKYDIVSYAVGDIVT
jgi:hypothetical protein